MTLLRFGTQSTNAQLSSLLLGSGLVPRSLHPRPSSSAGKHWECHQTCVDKADRLQKGRWTTEAVVQSLPVGQPPKGRTGEASLAAQHLKERHRGSSAGSVGSCDLARTAKVRNPEGHHRRASTGFARRLCAPSPQKDARATRRPWVARRSGAVRVCWKPMITNSRPQAIPGWFNSAKLAGWQRRGRWTTAQPLDSPRQPNGLLPRRTGKASFAAQALGGRGADPPRAHRPSKLGRTAPRGASSGRPKPRRDFALKRWEQPPSLIIS